MPLIWLLRVVFVKCMGLFGFLHSVVGFLVRPFSLLLQVVVSFFGFFILSLVRSGLDAYSKFLQVPWC
jgi:hypothetical protein